VVYFDGREVTEIDHPLLSSYLIDSESNLWLGSEVNLHRLLSTAFSFLTEDDGLPKNTWAIARDRHGHIWFGSLTGELIEYDGKKLIPRNDHRKVFPGDFSFFKGSITASDGTVYFVISSVGSVIMKGSAESAYDYIVALSGLLRSAIGDGSIMIRTLSDEIDFVRRYCELQKLRFRERFTYFVDIGEGTDMQRMLPKMTIQTFVENSVKHGIENRKEGGNIVVRVGRLNDALLIVVSDNGVGREAAAASGIKGFGQGIRTIERIFEFMNRFNREKAGFEIHDLFDASGNAAGTEIRIIVPDIYRFDVPEGKEAKEK